MAISNQTCRLTPEEIAQLRKGAERRFILALALRTIMAILGCFAGQD